MENQNSQNIPNIQQQVKPSYSKTFKEVFLSVGITNIAIKTILSPLERWKIISQTQMSYPLRPKKFKGFFNFIKRVPSEQGLLSLWRGNMTYCWMHFYQLFFQIFCYDTLREDLQSFRESNQNQIKLNKETSLLQNILFPFVANIISLGILHPLDSYRVRLSMSYHTKPSDAYFLRFRQFISYMKRQQSTRAVYRGFWLANIISFLNFHIYFNIAKSLSTNQNTLSPDIISSFLGILLLHPLDSLKKIMQLNNMSRPTIISGYKSALNYIKQNSSYQNLYNGITASFVKLGLSMGLFWFYQNYRKQNKQIKNIQTNI